MLPAVSIVVPTFGREQVLLDTVAALLELSPPALEVLVIDQTPAHVAETERHLEEWQAGGVVRWLRRAQPSIPGAMNDGLIAARGERVLFVDDDVVPATDLVMRHAEAAVCSGAAIVAGQVLQPGDLAEPLVGKAFRFSSSAGQSVTEVAGGNFSVDRAFALSIGGFDENFVEVAYRFEAEFCDRASAAGATIWFEPRASLRHLRAGSGGTRAYGDHLRTARPAHAVGEYYYWLTAVDRPDRRRRILTRPWRAIRTRHHLTRPWWIPVTLIAELRGFARARRLARAGRKLLDRQPPAKAPQ
jgi:GT2 family glycosyltransferase